MIWTLLAFIVTLYVLKRLAFPRINEALDKRQRAIEESIEAAERTRREADELLEEYRERLKEARAQAEEIVVRARKAAETAEREALEEAREKREELLEQTRRDIEAETQRALEEIRKEVADLTVLATEKVTRKALDRRGPAAPRRGGAERARLRGPGRRGADGTKLRWRRSPRSTRGRCSRRPRSSGKLDEIREELATFADAVDGSRDLQVFLFSPYFSTDEKKDGLRRAIEGADETFLNFLERAGGEPPHAGDLPHPSPVRRAVGRRRTACCRSRSRAPSTLDEATVRQVGDTIGEQTGRSVELSSQVDPDILGGIVVRVGNVILDASIRNRLEQLRKQVAKAA